MPEHDYAILGAAFSIANTNAREVEALGQAGQMLRDVVASKLEAIGALPIPGEMQKSARITREVILMGTMPVSVGSRPQKPRPTHRPQQSPVLH